nr:VOC family protein [uncultured Psychroserpens sp.]
MTNKLSHFAIYTEDIQRAKTFYSNLFGWDFNSYGPEDFLQIKHSKEKNAPLIGALQSKTHNPLSKDIKGFECSIEVENLNDTIKKIKENNGEIIMPKTEIPFVGWLTKFLDTEGNLVCAIQYKNKNHE